MKTLPKKYPIILIAMALALSACQPPADISGKLEGTGKENSTVYLLDPANLRAVAGSYLGSVIDSAIVNADGSFAFRNLPKVQSPVLFELAVQPSGKAPNYLETENPVRSNYMPIVWQSGVSLQITANRNEFQQSFSIENPSEINKAMLDIRDINRKAYQTYLSGKHWKVEDGSQLLEKEHAILQYQTELINFADSTQYLMPALVALRWVSPVNDFERVPEFLVNQCKKWKKKYGDHPWVKELCKQSDRSNLPVLEGDHFPNLLLPMLTGDTISLNSLLGKKLTIIDLWASWCAPCRKENRTVLVPVWDAYHNQGLAIVAYALESNMPSWRAASEKDGADRWYQASDLQGDNAPFLKKIRVQTIPANFILDNRGVVIAKNLHGRDLKDFVKGYFEKE